MLNCTTGGHGEPPAAGQTAGCSPPPSYLEHEKANVEGGVCWEYDMQPTRFSQPRPPRFLVLRNSDSVDEGFGWRSKSGRTVPLGVMANRWQLTPPPYLEHEKARFVQPNERLELQNNAGRRKTHTPCASPRRTSRAAKRAGTPKDHPKRAGIPKDHPKRSQGTPRAPKDPPRDPQGPLLGCFAWMISY